MHYYSQFGHKDFVLCLGYKANVIKEYFLNHKPQTYADCVVTGFGNQVEILGDPQQDWRIAMIDTGIWRNIGERLWAVREHVMGEEAFLANYSDGLSNINLPNCCGGVSDPPLDQLQLEFGDRLRGIQSLRAGFCAIHDGVTAIQSERILEVIEPFAGGFVAAVLDPAGGLQQRGGAQEPFAVPPVARA